MSKKMSQYAIIAQDIIESIQTGSLKTGDQIMTESQLCEKFHVSRMTANKALSILVSEGYITRTAGKGSFVSEPKITKLIGSSGSFSSDIRSINKTPGAILVSYSVVRASSVKNVAEQLELKSDELIHHIARIRTSDGVKIALSNTYIPCKHLPALDATILESSLYDYLAEEYDLHPYTLDYNFNAVLPTDEQKKLLQVDSCALLKVSHTSYTKEAIFFEYTETYYVGNRYTYHFHPTTSTN